MSPHAGTELTAGEFLALADHAARGRLELVNGRLVELAAERNRHVDDKMRAWVVLRDAVAAAGLDLHVSGDGVTVVIDERTVREPDALIQATPDPMSSHANRPQLVVEIVSPSSDATGNIAKLDEYFRVASIATYLVIDTYDGRVAVHERTDDGFVATRVASSGAIDIRTPALRLSIDALLGRTIR